MDLLLWRHAEAEDGDDDLARALTRRGRRQAELMAGWLRHHGPAGLQVIASPAVRAQQTAAALDQPIRTEPAIAPDAAAGDLLELVRRPEFAAADAALLLVGHQPTLGEFAALLLSGREAPWSIRKGALWWLTLRPGSRRGPVVVNAVLAPSALDRQA